MKYEITETTTTDEAGQAISTYGIRCGNQEISDISCTKSDIERLVSDCNEGSLDPIHLKDVVEDLLNA